MAEEQIKCYDIETHANKNFSVFLDEQIDLDLCEIIFSVYAIEQNPAKVTREVFKNFAEAVGYYKVLIKELEYKYSELN